jgi:pimeloyl-ACP methyl ester carboxylesterase
MLRGLSRDQRHWGRLPSLIEGAALLDLPGVGTEHVRPSPTTIAEIAEDLRARWLALRDARTGPWGLFAISLGGMVAMEWCAAHAGDFTRLVLVNSSARGLCPPWKRLRLGRVPTVVRALFDRDPVVRERRVLSMTTARLQDVDAVARRFAELHREQTTTRGAVLRQMLAALRFRAPARLDLPVLVLSGARDRFTHPDCPRRLAAHLGAKLEIHPEAGHDLALDDPEWVRDRVNVFA